MTMQDSFTAATYRDLIARLPQAVVVHDAEGRVVEANEHFASLLGYTLEEALRLHASDVIYPGDLEARDRNAEAMITGRRLSADVRRRLVTKSGSIVLARARKSTATLDGAPVVMVVIDDWTGHERRERQLLHDAHHDPLTGLPNRRALADHVASAEPAARLVAVLDLDGLKALNDQHGHHVGDLALVAVADGLRELGTAPDWFAARVGGDEFVVISTTGELDDAPRRADELHAAIENGLRTDLGLPDGSSVPLTVSAGTAPWTPGEAFSAAINDADADLYRRRQTSDR